MRYLIVASLLLSCSLCLADDLPQDTDQIKSLTAEQAADLVMVVKYARENTGLNLDGLTVIGKDGAQELPLLDALSLAKLAAQGSSFLSLNGLTSIDKYVAQELAKFEGSLWLNGLTSIDKDVAQELAKCKGNHLSLRGLNSIDKDVAKEFAKSEGSLWLNGVTSIDKDVAKELAQFKGRVLALLILTPIDEVSLAYLRSNKSIKLPLKHNGKY